MKQFLTLVFVLFCSVGYSQVGKDTQYWEWTEDKPAFQSVVKVVTSHGSGSGTVVFLDKKKEVKDGYLGYVLTANHVVLQQFDKPEMVTSIKVEYRNGKVAEKCSVLAQDKDHDIALIWVWVPKGIEAAELANDPAKWKDELEFAGFGADTTLEKIRCFKGVACQGTSEEKLFSDTFFIPGDSGGAAFNKEGKLVGVISGGWFWTKYKLKTLNGNELTTTWPATAGGLDPIKKLMTRIKNVL